MNSCIYTGRLTKDVEVRSEGNEKKKWDVAYFTIAVPDDFNAKKVDFIDCKAGEKNVKYLTLYGKKGAYIEFNGKTSTYTKDSKKVVIAVANKVSIIFDNSKKNDTNKETQGNQNTQSIDVSEDDLPF